MKIAISYPPNYDAIKSTFPIEDRDVVFTYGDTVYNPRDLFLPLHLIIHENVHVRQQGSPEKWWAQYLVDPMFRASQELDAYQAQYQWIATHERNREKKARFLASIATDMSGTMYGNMIGYADAVRLIRDYDLM